MSKSKKSVIIVTITIITLLVTYVSSYSIYSKWNNERHWVIADITSTCPSSFTNTTGIQVKFEYNNKNYSSMINNVPNWIYNQKTADNKIVVYFDEVENTVYMTQSNPIVAICPVIYTSTLCYIFIIALILKQKKKNIESN